MTKIITVEGITVSYPADKMAEEEIPAFLEAIPRLLKNQYPLISMDIEHDTGDSFIVNPHYDTVTRLRRITGYMSRTTNFNDAKQAELAARQQHMKL